MKFMSNADIIKENLARMEAMNEDDHQNVAEPVGQGTMEIPQSVSAIKTGKNETKSITDYMANKLKYAKSKIKKFAQLESAVHNYFIESAIATIFDRIMEEEMADQEDYDIGHKVIHNFVEEEGYETLVKRFSHKNLIISEMARLAEKYSNEVISECVDKCNNDSNAEDVCYTMDAHVAQNFVKDIENLVPERSIKLIRNRVANSMDDFFGQNAENKAAIMDIYNQAVEKNAALNDAKNNELVKEDYIQLSKIRSNKIYNRPSNMLGAMINTYTESILKDESLKEQYIDESNHLNMDKIVNANVVMYTVLEELNTMQMIDTSPEYIKNILKGI